MKKQPTSEAELLKKKPTPIADLKEVVGSPRQTFQGPYTRSEQAFEDKNVPIEDYRKMWQNDGQVAAIVNLPKMLLLGAGYDIVDEDDMADETPEHEFIEEMLEKLSTPLDTVIEDMTYAPFEGVRFYELVYDIIDGKLQLVKIASRDNLTCYPANDENGEFIGFWQYVTYMGQTKTVFIPKDKAISLVFNEAYGGLNGMSILKAAHYHWDKKHKLYFIAHLAAELQTVPPKILMNDNLSGSLLAQVETAVDELGLQGRVTIPKGATLETLSVSGSTNIDIQALINHHNSLIAKSLLAQFIDLNSETAAGGSNASAISMTKIYLDFVGGLAKKIEGAINEIIKKVCDYNFGTEVYPEFRFKPITDDNKALMTNIFMELVKQSKIGDTTTQSILSNVTEDLGLEFSEEEYQAEMEEKKVEQEKANEMKQQQLKAVVSKQPIKEAPKTADLVELEDAGMRPMYEDEMDVNWLAESQKLDSINEVTVAKIREILSRATPQAVADIRDMLDSGDYSRLDMLQIGSKEEIILALEQAMRETYEYGKLEANKELKTPAESTKPEDRAIISLGARNNGSKVVEDLKSEVINIVRNDSINGVDKDITLRTVQSKIDDFITKRIGLVVDQNVIGSFNQGLLGTFKINEANIQGYRYSAILDSRTTEFCRSLDGKVFAKDDPRLAQITPPNHFRCRSRLVPIKNGKPFSPSNVKVAGFDALTDFQDRSALLADVEKKVIELSEKEKAKDSNYIDQAIDKLINSING